MHLHIFTCLNDKKCTSLAIFQHPNIHSFNIRSIHDVSHTETMLVLLYNHSTNGRMINYIRKRNILTPIYIASEHPIHYKEINGVISPNNISYDALCQYVCKFPQQFIWDFAFEKDQQRRLKQFHTH